MFTFAVVRVCVPVFIVGRMCVCFEVVASKPVWKLSNDRAEVELQ